MELSPQFTAKTPLEKARKEYHDATVEMADIDARMIDVAASLEELKDRHGKSIIRVNEARANLVEARSPQPQPQPALETGVDRKAALIEQLARTAACIQDEAPANPAEGDTWVRPEAREALKFLSGAWAPRNFTTADIQARLTVDEVRAIADHPLFTNRAARAA